MRLVDKKELTNALEAEIQNTWDASSSGPMTHKSYHEMSDFPVVEVDAMTQLENNVQLLEDMQGRLSFLMREVRYILKA
jgi:hypothetical protein